MHIERIVVCPLQNNCANARQCCIIRTLVILLLFDMSVAEVVSCRALVLPVEEGIKTRYIERDTRPDLFSCRLTKTFVLVHHICE